MLKIRRHNQIVDLWSENHMFDVLPKVCGAAHAQGAWNHLLALHSESMGGVPISFQRPALQLAARRAI